MAFKPVVNKDISGSGGGVNNKPLTNGYHDELTEPPSSSASSTTSSSASSQQQQQQNQSTSLVDDEELKRLLSTQLEFYFSRENLLHDKYLISQMDSDSYVPLVILASFNMIRKLFANSTRFSSIPNGK